MSEVRKQRGSFLDTIFSAIRGRRVTPTDTVGVSGTASYGGYLQRREKDAKLEGRERYRTFSDILANTSIVAAGVRFFLNLIGKAEWKFEPADNSPAALEFAKRTEAALRNMTTPWRRVVRRASMYRFYGFSWQEWTAKRADDGSLDFLDVEPRAQITIERWDLDETGTVFGVIQRSPQTQQEIYLPRGKSMYLVDDSINDSPEGMGIFRNVVDAARRLARLEQLEGYAYETDLRGIPVGRAPLAELDRQVALNAITQQQRDAYIGGLTTFLQKHIKNPELGILLDSRTYESTDEAATPSSVKQWDIELLTGGATAHADVARAIERLNREIARVLGVESLLLGSTGTGSLALSQEKAHNFALIVDDTLGEIAEAVQADLITRLFEINGWPLDMRPKAKTESTNIRNVEGITAALRDLATAGAPVDPSSEAVGEIYDLLGLTRPNLDAIGLLIPFEEDGKVALTPPTSTPTDEVPNPEEEK